MLSFFDAHNHLQDAWLSPHRNQIFTDLKQIPLAAAVVNGTAESDWPDVTALAEAHPFIRPSYGLHPWNVGNAGAAWRDRLQFTLDSNPRAVIGEIGLDRWILERARPDDSRLMGLRRASLVEQREAFLWQLEIAAQRNLPVTLHCIDAWGALLDALRNAVRPARGFLLHAYAGSAELAREFAALGAYFSFNGYFLGKRHAPKRATFATLPLDRLLVETDAPAMPPPPEHRPYSLTGLADGNPLNHPANIVAVYAGLTALRDLPVESLIRQVDENFQRLFGP